MKPYFRIISAAAIAAAILTGCDSSQRWTVNGTVADADGSTLMLEAPGRAGWYVMDSVRLLGNGSFSMSQPALQYPEVFRLTLDGRQIYFPVDSSETVTVTTSAAGFGSDYTLAGSVSAEMLAGVDKRVRQAAAGEDSLLKRDLSDILISDPSSIVAYYIVRKQIDGRPLFDPSRSADLRMIGAVANAYDQYRHDDPRTAQLKDIFLSNKRVSVGATSPRDTIYAAEVDLFDIKLYDKKGIEQSLIDVASKNKAVILNYTLYTADASPALNLQLAKAYDRFHDRGLEIYQVAADPDEYAWRQSAANLPWLTVYQTPVSPASNLLNYNVTVLPATFLIVNGEIRERIDDPAKIADAVAKVL